MEEHLEYRARADYMAWAAVSLCASLAMSVLFLTSPDTRRLPGLFIIFRGLCELAFSISVLTTLSSESASSSDACRISGMVNQVAITASNLWIVVMSFDLVRKVKNPFDVRSFMLRYHVFVWTCAAVSPIVTSLAGVVGQNQFGFCYIEPVSDSNDYRKNQYRWALLYLPCGICLLATTVMMWLVGSKLKYGLQLSHIERRRVISHGQKYVRLFVVYWVLLGALYFSAAMVDPHPSSWFHTTLKHAFPVFIAGHGLLLFLCWLWVNQGACLLYTSPSPRDS
eukprot:TRINITY_DN2537_c0_g1_i3.p1 TRINITY_DN2537_c0_g1~~TRINITY_DN2537_c0_g1_i3.p1  ORF type:complete len:281 (-),score=63.22 TRINITY_DN2537_c0_g1_i3:94-936(-)